MNAPFIPARVEIDSKYGARFRQWEAEHAADRVEQMAAVRRWSVADQIKLLRQIATDIHTERTFSRTAQHEALIVMDQADDLERLLVTGEEA